MYEPKRICAAPECKRRISIKCVMCRWHWYQVPRKVRKQLLATYFEYQSTQSSDASQRYQTALKEAVAVFHTR